ncbi:MAG: carboxymuconolactone decarboxylase family protein [Acidobacteriota bacterium]
MSMGSGPRPCTEIQPFEPEVSRVAFIKTIGETEATGRLKKIYDKLTTDAGVVDNVLKIHSLNLPSLEAHLKLYRHLMFGPSGLTRRQREMIAVTVSVLNHCHY